MPRHPSRQLLKASGSRSIAFRVYRKPAMTKLELFRFMAAQKLAVVGSVEPAGEPQSALVGIAVTEELEVIFDTLNTTRKYRKPNG
ncbi:MAG TPA: hypothetical protein VIX90_04540 [Edaphobacter sp.]